MNRAFRIIVLTICLWSLDGTAFAQIALRVNSASVDSSSNPWMLTINGGGMGSFWDPDYDNCMYTYAMGGRGGTGSIPGNDSTGGHDSPSLPGTGIYPGMGPVPTWNPPSGGAGATCALNNVDPGSGFNGASGLVRITW